MAQERESENANLHWLADFFFGVDFFVFAIVLVMIFSRFEMRNFLLERLKTGHTPDVFTAKAPLAGDFCSWSRLRRLPPLPCFLEVLILMDFKSFEPEVLILMDFKSLFPEVLILVGLKALRMSWLQKIAKLLEVLILGEL